MNVHVNPSSLDRRLTPDPLKTALARGGLRAKADLKPAPPTVMARQQQAKTRIRYRLQWPDQSFVNCDLSGVVPKARDGWIGFLHQLEAVRRSRPDLADCKAVIVFPEGTGGVTSEVGFRRS